MICLNMILPEDLVLGQYHLKAGQRKRLYTCIVRLKLLYYIPSQNSANENWDKHMATICF